jgi:hypothetical protein
MQFFHTQLFTTPKWLMDASILNKFANPSGNERVQTLQVSILKSLLDKSRLYRITTSQTRFGASSYALNEMMDDLRKGLFSDVSKADIYRRNLQKTFVSQLDDLLNPSASASAASAASALARIGAPSADVENTDVVSEAKAQLKKLSASLQAAKATATDANAVNHINDLQDRIKQALDPK